MDQKIQNRQNQNSRGIGTEIRNSKPVDHFTNHIKSTSPINQI